jgi:predicted transposase/invertase (TIGR01784 family)
MAENKNETLKKARIEMNYLTGDAEVRRLAELREKWEMDRVSAINHATRVEMEKGIIKTAQNLIKMGMPIEQIAKATGLSEEEIEKIKKS